MKKTNESKYTHLIQQSSKILQWVLSNLSSWHKHTRYYPIGLKSNATLSGTLRVKLFIQSWASCATLLIKRISLLKGGCADRTVTGAGTPSGKAKFCFVGSRRPLILNDLSATPCIFEKSLFIIWLRCSNADTWMTSLRIFSNIWLPSEAFCPFEFVPFNAFCDIWFRLELLPVLFSVFEPM